MTETTTNPEDRGSEPGGNRLAWALCGGVFVADAFIIDPLLKDGGMVAQFSALIGLIILLIPMVRIVVDDIRRQHVRMNELALLAVLASATRGDLKTAGVVAFIMLLTLILESRTAAGARASLEALARLTPGKARRLSEAGDEELVDPTALSPGDRLRIRPGESVHADGTIVSGSTSLQEATITGESVPADKSTGDTVFSGTVNLTGVIEITVEKVGSDTTLGKVRELILEAEKTRLPVVRLIDRYVHYYTPLVLLFAALIWGFTGDMVRLVSLFVVACPIAVFLATPSAMVAALSSAARMGILIKNVSDIERIARANAFVFDKTGTLTSGQLSVSRLAPADGIDSAELLACAASAERDSNHPVALAVRALAEKAHVPLSAPDDLHEEPGRGVRARVADRDVIVGNWAWAEANGGLEADFPEFGGKRTAGMSLLFVLKSGRPMGWIGLTDEPRPESSQCISQLRALGAREMALITGDRADVAERTAGDLGITEWRGDCVPADKVVYVENMKTQGNCVVFIGDGVNDGPALAASHIGVALGAAGSDVALESATIALMNSDLNRLPFLVSLSRVSRHVIVQNVSVGACIIGGGVCLSALGALSPVAAACLQVCGAILVVLNSARLIREGEDFSEDADG